MLREIIVPTENTYLLKLPDEMIGKEVEVIAFDLSDKQSTTSLRKEINVKQYHEAIAFFKKNAVDFSKLKKWTREDLYE